VDTLEVLNRTGQDAPGGDAGQDVLERVGTKRPPRIRCPKCGYQPRRDDRWMCEPGCGHEWNTFDTRALCPGCGYQWRDTSCPRCEEWSPHDDWYEPSSDAQ
jgi:hypothetical protein